MIKSKQNGFTLIELLVVIAIIGILSAIVLASLGSARENAKATAILSNLRNAMVTAELHHTNNGSYEGLCDNEDIQQVVSALQSTGDGVACWVVTNYSGYVGNYREELKMIDYGIAATYNDNYYAASPQGAVTFDEENTVSGTSNWNSARAACSDEGKRLPTPSELRAIYDIESTTPIGFTEAYHWSALESPSLSTNAYILSLDHGGLIWDDKSAGWYVRCVD